MRILLLSALLAVTASCAAPQPQAATPVAGAPPPALAAPVPLAPQAAAVTPAPAAAPAPVPAGTYVDYRPIPLIWVDILNSPAGAQGRLTLSNFGFGETRVQTVVTSAKDCAVAPGSPVNEFVLPLNGTRVILPPRGADVCWRREVSAAEGPGAATAPWTGWNRAFTSTGRSIDSRL